MSLRWDELTSAKIASRQAQGWTTAILPLGATEQHGQHLSVSYDSLFATRLAEDLARVINAFVLPTLAFGVSSHHMGFAGTLSISQSTLRSVLYDLAESLELSGFIKLVIVNGHGGNYETIREVAESSRFEKLTIIHDGFEQYLLEAINAFSAEYGLSVLGLHAGLFETSLALYTHPASVDTGLLAPGSPLPPAEGEARAGYIRDLLKNGLKMVAPNGVIGNPIGSSSKMGKQFYEKLLQLYVGLCLSK